MANTGEWRRQGSHQWAGVRRILRGVHPEPPAVPRLAGLQVSGSRPLKTETSGTPLALSYAASTHASARCARPSSQRCTWR
jgi:hypothetical protein